MTGEKMKKDIRISIIYGLFVAAVFIAFVLAYSN